MAEKTLRALSEEEMVDLAHQIVRTYGTEGMDTDDVHWTIYQYIGADETVSDEQFNQVSELAAGATITIGPTIDKQEANRG